MRPGLPQELLDPKATHQPIALAERIAKDHHVGTAATKRGRELLLIRASIDDVKPGLLVEKAIESGMQGGMVVDDQHAHGACRASE